MRKVLLTRAKEQAIESAERLRMLGWEPVLLPLYEMIALPAPLISNQYTNLIVTSQNAVHAANSIPKKQRPSIACYVVGEKSAELLRHDGFSIAMVCGTAADLLAGMQRDILGSRPSGPLLYLRGAEVKLDLKAALSQLGITVEDMVVYHSIARNDLPVDAFVQVDAALFYSSRNSELFSELANKDPSILELLRHITAIAISSDTAHALHQLPFKQIVAAKEPTEGDMLKYLAILD